MVSIIVPIYNAKDYLPACIDSLLAQDYQDIEIILADDGSSDRSGIICDEYAANHNKIRVIHKANGGVSSARNAGISVASGDFITFVDADDVVSENYLSSFSFEHDFSIQGYLRVRNGLISRVTYESVVVDSDVAETFCENGYANAVWGKLFCKDIIIQNNIEFPEWLSFSEDTIFSLRYVKCCKNMHVTDATEYKYFVRDNNSGVQRKYPLDILMRKEETLYGIYEDIYDDSDRKKVFFHELSLNVVSKYYFYYNVDNYFIEHSYLKTIKDRYLYPMEKSLLNVCGIVFFANYVRWRNRLRKHILLNR